MRSDGLAAPCAPVAVSLESAPRSMLSAEAALKCVVCPLQPQSYTCDPSLTRPH